MKLSMIFGAGLAVALATAGMAQDGPSRQEKARQGLMNVLALNLGVLGGMAKGETDFNADAASAAASSISAVARIDQSNLWPKGSDNAASSTSRALPAIWDQPEKFNEIWAQLGTAAVDLEADAALGADSLGAGLGEIGKTCKSCHEGFRASKN